MPELKLGTKHNCYNCGTKFYDLGKAAPLCPKCGADQRDSGHSESPTVSQASRRRRKADVAKPIDIEEDEPIADVADDELVEPELDDDEIAGADAEEDIDDED
ncbi:MAG TPA: TIGR02300 family protein [Thermoanaerobaculia bacterium]|nr:TIGR02300 family protein [Thermoanaerobaculia bacterium]